MEKRERELRRMYERHGCVVESVERDGEGHFKVMATLPDGRTHVDRHSFSPRCSGKHKADSYLRRVVSRQPCTR